MLSTGSSVNGSMRALTASGISSMSEDWMPFQPAIDEPSKAWPSSNLSLVKCLTGTVTCCSLPRVSVKRRSTNFTSLSLISFNTSSGVIAICGSPGLVGRSEEHTSELQSQSNLVCRLLLEKKKNIRQLMYTAYHICSSTLDMNL